MGFSTQSFYFVPRDGPLNVDNHSNTAAPLGHGQEEFSFTTAEEFSKAENFWKAEDF